MADPWWDDNWFYRRRVIVRAGHEDIPMNHPVTVELDTDLSSSGRAQSDLKDIRVTYDRDLIPSSAETTPDRTTLIYFFTRIPIPSDFGDAYYIYYGNPDVI